MSCFQCSQEENVDLDDAVVSSDFNFLYRSTKYMPLIDQPVQRACVLEATSE